MQGNGITALVLCGGKGTRLQGLHPQTPKPLISVAGKPFAEWQARFLARQGWGDFVYAAGHLAEVVEAWVSSQPVPGCRMRAVHETRLLGTGGGILNGLGLCGDEVLALNGDSLLLFDLAPMVAALKQADFVIAGVYSEDCARFGSLDIGADGLLRTFREKQPGSGFINGGIYLLRKPALAGFPRGEVLSMETDIIPGLLRQGAKIAVHRVRDAPFLDIGLPQTLEQADGFIASHRQWFDAA